MKPFDLEAAKRGEKVITRRGLPVRILCFDRKGVVNQEIIALVEAGSAEFVWAGTSDGKSWDREEQNDLLMAPAEQTLYIVTWQVSGTDELHSEVFALENYAEERASHLQTMSYCQKVKTHRVVLEV